MRSSSAAESGSPTARSISAELRRKPLDHRLPAGVVELEHVEVVRPLELDEPHERVALRVPAALGDRDDVVLGAVHEELRDAERGQRRRRSSGEELGALGERAEETLDGAVAEILAPSALEVGDAGLGDRRDRTDARLGADAAGEPVTRRE